MQVQIVQAAPAVAVQAEVIAALLQRREMNIKMVTYISVKQEQLMQKPLKL